MTCSTLEKAGHCLSWGKVHANIQTTHSLTHTTIHPRGYAHSLQLNVGSVELSAEMLTVGLLSVRAEVCPLYDQLFIALPVHPHCNTDAPNAAVVSE